MRDADYALLLADVEHELLAGGRAAVLGATTVAARLLRDLAGPGLLASVVGVYADRPPSRLSLAVPIRSLPDLATDAYDTVVVAADAEKEDLLLAALPHLQSTPKVVVSGYGHLAFREPEFQRLVADLLVPSLANGYPYSLPHIYQCMVNAARLGLEGVVVEFGMFKGGTTMFMARLAKHLGANWPVLGFDTFAGFPPRRSPLDMYAHPDCIFTDLAAVQRYLSSWPIEIVTGDIVATIDRLAYEDVVLSFVDTDNYTSAVAALEIVSERTVIGGAIVFDHYTGSDRFRYTLGERLAARRLLNDTRYFHLHGTGVFYRQR